MLGKLHGGGRSDAYHLANPPTTALIEQEPVIEVVEHLGAPARDIELRLDPEGEKAVEGSRVEYVPLIRLGHAENC